MSIVLLNLTLTCITPCYHSWLYVMKVVSMGNRPDEKSDTHPDPGNPPYIDIEQPLSEWTTW